LASHTGYTTLAACLARDGDHRIRLLLIH